MCVRVCGRPQVDLHKWSNTQNTGSCLLHTLVTCLEVLNPVQLLAVFCMLHELQGQVLGHLVYMTFEFGIFYSFIHYNFYIYYGSNVVTELKCCLKWGKLIFHYSDSTCSSKHITIFLTYVFFQ